VDDGLYLSLTHTHTHSLSLCVCVCGLSEPVDSIGFFDDECVCLVRMPVRVVHVPAHRHTGIGTGIGTGMLAMMSGGQ
jgi:hypothetical protein